MKKFLLLAPFSVFLGLAFLAWRGLSLDTTVVPYAMIDKPLPAFDLPPIADAAEGFAREDLPADVTLINVFGSWCAGCHIEHDFLMALDQSDLINIYGINWKDTPQKGAEWLAEMGNPYTRVGNDLQGRTIIDLGVTGAPETFIIDAEGRIRWRHAGPLTIESWEATLWPLIVELKKEQHANL